MPLSFRKKTATSYDAVASQYAEKFQHELDYKPFDRNMLALLVEKVAGKGVICDMGCGPGQIAAYLHKLGAETCGIDISAQMVVEAKQHHPDITFEQGDMLALIDVADSEFAGIAAFYSIIHIPRKHVVKALRELKRVLSADGVLLLTFHIGSEVRHFEEFLEQAVDLDFAFFEVAEMTAFLDEAGFVMEEVIQRNPYPAEVQTNRAYVFARKST